MKTMLPTEVRNRWKEVLREVSEEAEEVRIHLKGGKGAVLLPEETYESLLATLEVLSDPDAVRTIRKYQSGKGSAKRYTLADVDRVMARRA